ncbi:Alpha/Beta hydrolase protein [Catenaria anguillulae PL171]|uniref:Carboxypeptidase n=1 Tax=Catenaria anguillulae PL171 TaxID=765915 RepID=A0A1Y2HXA2_9FUNG|nr:Alpha/Beta hydrolase protein [Catenaria anguillulae PL171]
MAKTTTQQASASDYYVRYVPNAPPALTSLRQYAGHVVVDSDVTTYFWLVLSQQQPSSNAKTVVWLNGGPGCSSLEGMLLENGPMLVDANGNLRENPHSWHKHANILYVDQPVGTGFSFSTTSKLVHDQVEMAKYFVGFLERFFELFPHLETSDVRLYLSGESYAGTYIPYIARAIVDRNAKVTPSFSPSTSTLRWSLQGMVIGNGWMDSPNQYRAYIDYAVKHNILNGTYLQVAESKWTSCKEQLELHGPLTRINVCEQIADQVMEQSKVNHGGLCMNVYDIRLRDAAVGDRCGAMWPDSLPGLYRFLHNATVVQFIHADQSRDVWTECADSVFNAFRGDKSMASVTLLPDLIPHVPLYLYSGDQDYICNHFGTEAMLKDLKWGIGLTRAPPSTVFYTGDERLGTIQQAGNITYALFEQASHMVPIDKPAGMLAFLDHVLGIQPVATKPEGSRKQPIGGNPPKQPPTVDTPVPVAPSSGFGVGFGVGMVVTLAVLAAAFAFIVYRRPLMARFLRRSRRGVKPARSDDQVHMMHLSTQDNQVLFAHGLDDEYSTDQGSDSEVEASRPPSVMRSPA